MTPTAAAEHVVLLDAEGNGIGTAPKALVHHERTPLHLAFSCYVFDADGRTLLTRRALGKPTWPGVWTNTLCGHPGPGEAVTDAIRRRALRELGLELQEIRLMLPRFGYVARMTNGVVENERCPVFTASTTSSPHPAADEVEDFAWVPWDDFCTSVLAGTRAVSPWCREQVAALPEDPRAAAEAPWADLPPAVRHLRGSR